MVRQIQNLNSLLCDGRERAITQLRQRSPDSLREFVRAALAHVAHAAGNAKTEDVPLLDILSELSISEPDFFGLKNSCTILIDSSFFHEQLGNFREGIRIGVVASELATKHGDVNLQRRVNNALGALSLRICDFQMACRYFEVALRLARKLANPLYECSVLGNIAGLFNAMGLNRDATRVFIRCLSYSGNTAEFRMTQAYNAVNALKISRLISDSTAADYSYKIACKRLKLKQFATNTLLLAYFEYGRALYLMDRGKQDLASRHINRAILQYGGSNNPRIDALLGTAKALCLFASGRLAKVRQAKRVLRQLLCTTKEFPTHHEDVLRGLIQVYGAESTLHGMRVSLKYAQQLRQYVLEEKQTRFSFQIGNGRDNSPSRYKRRSQDDSNRITLASLSYSRINDGPLSVGAEINAIYEGLVKVRESVTEDRFRTGAYSVAENWALAAEFSDDSSGRHCFRVGKLAGAIAFAIGTKPESCVEVELACRLHDIGKIAIDNHVFPRLRANETEGFRSVKEHTVAGARLLNCSTDKILRIAAIVAKYHHEWWNGCGYPDGLKGDAIPLEARICAFADTYDSLISPVSGHLAWTHKQAVQQICAMGGVQLDPGLISPFLEAVGVDAAASDRVSEEVDRSMERNQLARAKKKLFEALELVD